jgi:hypothetical protein
MKILHPEKINTDRNQVVEKMNSYRKVDRAAEDIG